MEGGGAREEGEIEILLAVLLGQVNYSSGTNQPTGVPKSESGCQCQQKLPNSIHPHTFQAYLLTGRLKEAILTRFLYHYSQIPPPTQHLNCITVPIVVWTSSLALDRYTCNYLHPSRLFLSTSDPFCTTNYLHAQWTWAGCMPVMQSCS